MRSPRPTEVGRKAPASQESGPEDRCSKHGARCAAATRCPCPPELAWKPLQQDRRAGSPESPTSGLCTLGANLYLEAVRGARGGPDKREAITRPIRRNRNAPIMSEKYVYHVFRDFTQCVG